MKHTHRWAGRRRFLTAALAAGTLMLAVADRLSAAERTATTTAVAGASVVSPAGTVSSIDFLYLLGAIGCQVGMVLAYRAASRPENNRHTVLVGAYLLSSAVSLGLGFFEFGAAFPWRVFAPTWWTLPMLLGIGGGIFLVFSAELYLRSTAHGPMSITWTIRQTETMPATVISFFLHPAQEFTLYRLIGVLLLPPTLLMFGWDKRVQERRRAAEAKVLAEESAARATAAAAQAMGRWGDAGGPDPAPPPTAAAPVPWIAMTIGSMLLLGTYRTGTLWVVKETKTPFMIYQYLSCTLVAFGFVLAQRHAMRWRELRSGMVLGVLSSVNLYFTLSAMATVGPVLTFATLAVGVPVTVTLVGVKLYGERLHWRSAVGMLLALAALLLTVKWQQL